MIDYIFEIGRYPFQVEGRITDEEIHDNLPNRPFWEYKKRGLIEIKDPECRKSYLEELKEVLPEGCILDVDKETLTCSRKKEYFEKSISQLQNVLSDPKNVNTKAPLWWWRYYVAQYKEYLFFLDNIVVQEFFSLHELMLEAMEDDRHKDENGDDIVYYFGGMFEYIDC